MLKDLLGSLSLFQNSPLKRQTVLLRTGLIVPNSSGVRCEMLLSMLREFAVNTDVIHKAMKMSTVMQPS